MMVRDPAEKVNPKVPAALSPEWLLLLASSGKTQECIVVLNAGLEAVNGTLRKVRQYYQERYGRTRR
jgi:hypothetical protein